MNNKQTAVEWLEEKLDRIGLNANIIGEYIEQAKEMEKQQMIAAHTHGRNVERGINDGIFTGEQYYKQTYEQQ